MHLQTLTLHHFRNISEASVALTPGMNFFLGDNAQGKTNALEAIYLFARGKSFRGATDAEMTQFGSPGFSCEIAYQKKDREETLFYSCFGKDRVRRKNGVALDRQSDIIGNFRAVLFSPDHLQMVKGSPSERRRFLDIAIAQCYPVYLKIYAKYQKCLDERNALLKMAARGGYLDRDILTVFSGKLAEFATEICLYRRRYCEKIALYTKDYLHTLSSGKEDIVLTYQSNVPPEITDKEEILAFYQQLFVSDIGHECAAGVTLYGVHRDDMLLSLGGIGARDYASQGQQRSIVLALKMAEGKYAADVCGEVPVFLLDDVLSELDENRRRFLLQSGNNAQFIVTGCEKSIMQEKDMPVNWITVKNGSFSSQNG